MGAGGAHDGTAGVVAPQHNGYLEYRRRLVDLQELAFYMGTGMIEVRGEMLRLETAGEIGVTFDAMALRFEVCDKISNSSSTVRPISCLGPRKYQ